MKKTALLIALMLLGGLAVGCGNRGRVPATAPAPAKSAKTSTRVKGESGNTNKGTDASKTVTAKNKSTFKAATTKMNFSQIKRGDYSSLMAGKWTQIASSMRLYNGTKTALHAGGSRKLTVTQDEIADGSMRLRGGDLLDAEGTHKLAFREKQGQLAASLVDQMVATNWAVAFFPSGTTNAYQSVTGEAKNKYNLIQVWNSINGQTAVYAENVSAADLKAYMGLDVRALAKGDYASLIGTWKNPTDGETLEVVDKMVKKPANVNLSDSEGIMVANQDYQGRHEVIIAGKVDLDGSMQASIGYFIDPTEEPSSMQPLVLLPKGVQAPALGGTIEDDSDMTRDRLILGGGQSGFAQQAYYKVD
ncbi:DUF6287 domain-containing protein [Lacticaseibacillus yichunensis]|uniref:DUF6287 domain-containing protein n=1 Tax=Lacticaseibacillus yichunensis TaxID=2486015 RepID=A0ABW4CS09_9LACO|nr:DUF6287 domain-containing protein [Lacticaseibacillus yichunensis]